MLGRKTVPTTTVASKQPMLSACHVGGLLRERGERKVHVEIDTSQTIVITRRIETTLRLARRRLVIYLIEARHEHDYRVSSYLDVSSDNMFRTSYRNAEVLCPHNIVPAHRPPFPAHIPH